MKNLLEIAIRIVAPIASVIFFFGFIYFLVMPPFDNMLADILLAIACFEASWILICLGDEH